MAQIIRIETHDESIGTATWIADQLVKRGLAKSYDYDRRMDSWVEIELNDGPNVLATAMDLRGLAKWLAEIPADEFRQTADAVYDVVKREAARRDRVLVDGFKPGDKVEFNGKRGSVWRGIVRKLNSTTVTVRATEYWGETAMSHEMEWRVHARTLRKVK